VSQDTPEKSGQKCKSGSQNASSPEPDKIPGSLKLRYEYSDAQENISIKMWRCQLLISSRKPEGKSAVALLLPGNSFQLTA
jgi:hypothetical protein